MKLSLGFSPCPNDTFIFDALVHQKIDTKGIRFEVILADVEELNQKAIAGDLDITKLSYHTYAYVRNQYYLMQSGGALGHQCGPLLIAKKPLTKEEITVGKIAIPGPLTTANFLFSLAYPEATNKIPYVFSDIENAVLQGEVDAGLIIHENRFTYQSKGLVKIIDLGEYWESKTKLPIPLGGIAMKRTHPPKLVRQIDKWIQASVQYAFDHPEDSKHFISQHAQEMDPIVCQSHIDLYVNQYSLQLGPHGISAVHTLFDNAYKNQLIPTSNAPLFAPF
jgi:1,4-dihydroxy-6-naphthoate synthase